MPRRCIIFSRLYRPIRETAEFQEHRKIRYPRSPGRICISPDYKPPLGNGGIAGGFEKKSRGLTRRQRLGGVLSSRCYSPPLGKRPNFRNSAEITYPRGPGRVCISPYYNPPLGRRRNNGEIQEKFAGINLPPVPRRRIIFSRL